jgi:TPR repeat protein
VWVKTTALQKKLYYEAAKLGLKAARDVILADANAGRVWAQLSLGVLYELGHGVAKDLQVAENGMLKQQRTAIRRHKSG